MSFLNKLAGLPASLKDSWKKTFGDVDVETNDDGAGVVDEAAPRAQLSLEQAWGIVGVAPGATLDDVRAAARARSRGIHARAAQRDADADNALVQLAAASELLEEHLLPALRGSAPSSSTSTSPTASSSMSSASSPPRTGRVRATPRAT
jgi:hypothetical protein